MTVMGLRMFPRDLLIFLPASSTTIPCVMSVPYGLALFVVAEEEEGGGVVDVATDVSSWLWNHPRC